MYSGSLTRTALVKAAAAKKEKPYLTEEIWYVDWPLGIG